MSGAESTSPDSKPEPSDEISDPEQVQDSDTEDAEFYAPIATTGSAAMDDSLNPAAAQLVADLRAFGMRQIDPHATMPNNEAAAKSHVRQKVLIQDRDHLRSCASSRRRSQLRRQTLNLDFRA